MEDKVVCIDGVEYIKGKRSTFFNHIPGLTTKGYLQDIIVVADKREDENLYPVLKDWIDLKDGIVTCPFPQVESEPGDPNEVLNYLINHNLTPQTTQIVFIDKPNCKQWSVKVNWRKLCLKGLYADFESKHLAAAYEFIRHHGSVMSSDDTIYPSTPSSSSQPPAEYEYPPSKRLKTERQDILPTNASKSSVGNEACSFEWNSVLIKQENDFETSHLEDQQPLSLEHLIGDRSNTGQLPLNASNCRSNENNMGAPEVESILHLQLRIVAETTALREELHNVAAMSNKIWEYLTSSPVNLPSNISNTSICNTPLTTATETATCFRTPLQSVLKAKYGFPIKTMQRFTQLEGNIDEMNATYSGNIREELKQYMYTFRSNKNGIKILNELIGKEVALSLSIRDFTGTVFYEIFEEFLLTWTNILPVVGNEKEWRRMEQIHGKKRQVKAVVHRWLRSKKEAANKRTSGEAPKKTPIVAEYVPLDETENITDEQHQI